jgi:glycerol-1-phosphate dehydrogenase [NAD(P)+]
LPGKTLVYCSPAAIGRLIEYCRSRRFDRFFLVSDENTYAVLGARAEAALKAHGWEVRTVVLSGEEVITGEEAIVQVLLAAGRNKWTYVAIGSGTVTDVTRFCSHRTRNDFISLPTAPSVDAYTSIGASLVVRKVKITTSAQPPVAVFADLHTLRQAPADMIAAGFADVLAKYIALADWELAAAIVDEPYSAHIAQRMRRALLDCAACAQEIGQRSAAGIEKLMAGLLESGRCMVDVGNSRPASGSEHLSSHFWEMRLRQQRRPPILHGARVGIGALLAAQRYEALRGLTQQDAVARLTQARPPDREAELARVQAAFGPTADWVAAEYAPFLERMIQGFDLWRQRIADDWADVLRIAASVPPREELAELLRQARAPSTPQEIGLKSEDVRQALHFSHYVRDRFTVNTVGQMLGLW